MTLDTKLPPMGAEELAAVADITPADIIDMKQWVSELSGAVKTKVNAGPVTLSAPDLRQLWDAGDSA